MNSHLATKPTAPPPIEDITVATADLTKQNMYFITYS